MRSLIAIALLVAACKSKKDDGAKAEPSAEPAKTAPAGGEPATEPAKAKSHGAGIAVTDSAIPDFAGGYDKVFAQLDDPDHKAIVAFVRDCAQLTCETGAWEPGQVAKVCPKAYIATFEVPGLDAGDFTLSLKLAGPADNAATGTIEGVKVRITQLDHDGVAGEASQKTTDASVSGSFKAEVCPRT